MQVIDSSNICGLIQRTLNHIDERLVDHGKRVAFIVYGMMKTSGIYQEKEIQDMCFVALLHDVGAYKTEEIDRMVEFETQDVWAHSIYGSLFIKHLTSLKEYGSVILYHHMDYEKLEKIKSPYKEFAQMVFIADRADVYMESPAYEEKLLFQYFDKEREKCFGSDIIDLFWRANEMYGFTRREISDQKFQEMFDSPTLTCEEMESFIKMLIFAIDFRSRHTVTHTITTTRVSRMTAELMELSPHEQQCVYYGAMLHDLGKIGIPVEILEFPGKLSAQAMGIMRTHVDVTKQIFGGCIDSEVEQISLRHHEKLDGSGYPRGIDGTKLTLPQRIVAVSDIVSALCGTRSYKDAYSKEKTLGIICQMADDGLIDREVVDVIGSNFDLIMDKVQEASAPALEKYNLINQEYEEQMLQMTGVHI